jgi:RNA polymerase sigma factor (sigma-70 family)
MRVYAHQMRSRNDDATLVRRTQAGDTRAFEAIFKRHHAPLLSYCRHILSSQDEAEDALQQAFVKAHQALLGGTAPRELRPWLYAIARNCCLTAIAARRPTAPLENRTPSLAGLSEEVHQREDLRELLAGIGRLPEDQRSALLLAELGDLSHQAIATIVGCEVSKVKALIYQARSALIADRDARNTPCRDIREQLAVARGGELRRGPLRRHLKLCAGCRDFQLALGAQRQALGALLPVAPSARLATAILGHGAAHAGALAGAGAGHASGVGVGLASGTSLGSGVGVGTGVGSGAAGAAASGGTGLAASGSAATTTAVSAGAGAGAGGSTGIGALLGGGLVTKLAVGGAVVVLATAGAVTVHNREAHASPRRVLPAPTELRSAGANEAAVGARATDIADSSNDSSGVIAIGSPAALGLVDGTRPPGADGFASLGSLTEPSGLDSADSLLTTSGAPAPSGATPGPAQPAAGSEQGKGGAGNVPAVRARRHTALLHRRAALRRRALARRRALLRRERAARRRARRKALKRRHSLVKPPSPKPVVTPAPAPVRVHRRKAHPTAAPIPVTTVPVQGTGTESKDKEGKRKRRRSTTSTETGAGTGTGTASTETGSETETKPGTGKTGTKTGTGTTGAETAKGRSNSEPGGGETDEEGPGGSTGSPGKPAPKGHSGAEEQPTNLRGAPEVTGVDVQNPTEQKREETHDASS